MTFSNDALNHNATTANHGNKSPHENVESDCHT